MTVSILKKHNLSGRDWPSISSASDYAFYCKDGHKMDYPISFGGRVARGGAIFFGMKCALPFCLRMIFLVGYRLCKNFLTSKIGPGR